MAMNYCAHYMPVESDSCPNLTSQELSRDSIDYITPAIPDSEDDIRIWESSQEFSSSADEHEITQDSSLTDTSQISSPEDKSTNIINNKVSNHDAENDQLFIATGTGIPANDMPLSPIEVLKKRFSSSRRKSGQADKNINIISPIVHNAAAGMEGYNTYAHRLIASGAESLKSELHALARQNCADKLQTLCELIRNSEYDLCDKLLLGSKSQETALVVAVVKDSTESAKVLIKYGGANLIQMSYDTKQYVGVTAFHLAILKQNINIIRFILESLDSTVKSQVLRSRGYGMYFNDIQSFAWYPLGLAAGVGSIEIFNLLLHHGANPLLRDLSTGNTIFHCLARVATRAPQQASETLKGILNSIEVKNWWQKQKNDASMNSINVTNKHRNLPEALLKLQNYDGYTPLAYATCLGATEFAAAILDIDNLYKFPQWNVGPDQFTLYEVSEIDPVVAGHRRAASVLEAYSFILKDDRLDFGKVPAVRQTLENKFNVYKGWFTCWFVFHCLLMAIFTFYTVQNHGASTQDVALNQTEVSEWFEPLYRRFDSVSDIASVVMEGFIVSSAFLYFILELLDIISLLRKKYWRSQGFNGVRQHTMLWLTLQFDTFRVILLIFSLSIFTNVVLLSYHSPWMDLATAVASISGWTFLLFFTRAFKNMGVFTVMMQRMIIRELFYFAIVITLMLIAYGTAIFSFFKTSSQTRPEQVNNWCNTVFSLFRLMVGLEEFAIFDDARVPWMMKIIFVMFILCVNILLFNMLIAAMNNTYNLVEERKELMWLQMRTKAVLLIERRLATCVRPHHGLERLDRKRPEAWFLGFTDSQHDHPLAQLTDSFS